MFTKLQVDEILAKTEIRLETIQDDPSSADSFESVDSLELLISKLENGNFQFNELEKKFMIEEFEDRINMAESNRGNEGNRVQPFINSMVNAIQKLSQCVN